ncbi:MAG: hypothetical protein ACW98F_01530 [Candidatus Hodarchaeales archaeon]|jgi:hypothetical protein
MSSWQSFFNELTKTAKLNNQRNPDVICHCEKGKLTVIDESNFKTLNNCSMSLFCSIIQIDRHRAKNFNNQIAIMSRDIKDQSPYDNRTSLNHLLNKNRNL